MDLIENEAKTNLPHKQKNLSTSLYDMTILAFIKILCNEGTEYIMDAMGYIFYYMLCIVYIFIYKSKYKEVYLCIDLISFT